jgi:hypothetical protein
MIMLLRIADAGGLNLLVGFNVLIFVPKFAFNFEINSEEIKILMSNRVGLALSGL